MAVVLSFGLEGTAINRLHIYSDKQADSDESSRLAHNNRAGTPALQVSEVFRQWQVANPSHPWVCLLSQLT